MYSLEKCLMQKKKNHGEIKRQYFMMRNILFSWPAPPLPSCRATNLLAWLWAVGREEKSQWGENNQSPKWIKQSKTLQASSTGAVCSHHPKLSTDQLAFHLQQVASLPRACAVLEHRQAFEMTRTKEKKGLGFQVLFLLKKRKEEGKK